MPIWWHYPDNLQYSVKQVLYDEKPYIYDMFTWNLYVMSNPWYIKECGVVGELLC